MERLVRWGLDYQIQTQHLVPLLVGSWGLIIWGVWRHRLHIAGFGAIFLNLVVSWLGELHRQRQQPISSSEQWIHMGFGLGLVGLINTRYRDGRTTRLVVSMMFLGCLGMNLGYSHQLLTTNQYLVFGTCGWLGSLGSVHRLQYLHLLPRPPPAMF